MPELTEQQTEWLTGLRALADFCEEHPEAIERYAGYEMNHFVYSVGNLAALVRQIGGKWEKSPSMGQYFVLRQWFGPHHIDINAAREDVCTKVGEETVLVPDPDAPKIERKKPIWECPPSVLALAGKS